ncbi:MAG: TetR/AcrR family transcriptional regulator [Acidobacteria bacterium]|nr:TetR/AcrR family transcriptional regulator [Acidobacteriota bacterium]
MTKKQNLAVREHILSVAQQLIYEQGFKGVSMENVAVAAKIKKANLFHYYPTKEALALAVFDYASDGFKQWINSYLIDSSDSPLNNISQMFDSVILSMQESHCKLGCFVGNLAQELSNYNENIRIKISNLFSYWIEQLGNFLALKQTQGHFHTSFNPNSTAEVIISLLEGSLLIAKAKKDTQTIENAKQMALSYLKTFII